METGLWSLEGLFTVESLIALLALTALEIVLGIDNVVFISILSSRLEPSKQKRARRLGLIMAMVGRILLVLAIGWIMGLNATLFEVLGKEISGKSLILLAGGAFLVGKATHEIYVKVEGDPKAAVRGRAYASFGAVLFQILLMDLVFSIDSVITAVGVAKKIHVMIAAIVISIVVMLIFAEAISRFIERHPSMKILALAFLVLIGVVLVADGLGEHIRRGYIYTAMAFALAVELLQLRVAKKHRKHAAPSA